MMHKKTFLVSLMLLPLLLVSCSKPKEEEFKSYWGDAKVEETIENTIKYDIPYYAAPSYEVDSFKDALNDDVMVIYFQGYDEDKVDSNRDKYVNVCMAAGYTNNSDKIDNGHEGTTELYTLTKSIGDRQNILLNVVSGRVSETSPYCFAAFASRFYDYKSEVFPNYVLEHYFNYTIPTLKTTDSVYTCTAGIDPQSGLKNCYIEISNVDRKFEQDYFKLLKSNGYTIDSDFYDDFGYMATSKNSTHKVQFKYVELATLQGEGIAIFTWPLNQENGGQL